MPPLAAVAVSVMSAASAAASAVVGTAIAAAPAIGAGAGIYSVVEGSRQAEKARTEAASQFQQQIESTERQAGEYYQLSGQQMELQTQAASIQTLANLITERRQPAAPQVFTLPAAKEYSAVEQINQAIDKMLRG